MMTTNTLPSIRDAKLPGAYVQAKDALEKCWKIDECQNWADRAAALASYARQAEDESLRTHATRIQARAIRRCGELLKRVESAQGQRTDLVRELKAAKDTADSARQLRTAAGTKSRKDIAQEAGLSKRQKDTALRIASIPKARFEREVESDDPPTVTKLAEMGKLPKWAERLSEAGKKPGFQRATRLMGLLREFAHFCDESDPRIVADAVLPKEAADMKKNLRTVDRWLQRFLAEIRIA